MKYVDSLITTLSYLHDTVEPSNCAIGDNINVIICDDVSCTFCPFCFRDGNNILINPVAPSNNLNETIKILSTKRS
jgi:hypothetical protein